MLDPQVLDIENVGEPWDGELLCVGWVKTAYAPLGPNKWDAPMVHMLANPEIPMITHTKHDVRWLRLAGWEVAGQVYDTQVMAWVLNENQDLSLDALALKYCDIKMDKRIRSQDTKPVFRRDDGIEVPLEDAPLDQLLAYNERDLIATKALFDALYVLLDVSGWAAYYEKEELPFTEALLDMECQGMPINLDKAAVTAKEFTVELDEQALKLNEMLGYGGTNYGSWKQLIDVLFSKVYYVKDKIPHGLDLRQPTLITDMVKRGMGEGKKSIIKRYPEWIEAEKQKRLKSAIPKGFTVEKVTHQNLIGYWTRKGLGLTPTKPNVDKFGKKADHPSTRTPDLLVLHPMEPFVQELVKWRKLEKAIEFLESYPKYSSDGYLFARANQTGTKTGRISNSKTNLQNQPAHGPLGEIIRSLFEGAMIIADYSQLEPRLMAHFSADPVLMDIYLNNKDIYLTTAEMIFGKQVEKGDDERQIAKTNVLSMGYGAGAAKVAQTLCLNGFPTTTDTAQGYLTEMQQIYSTFFEWRESVIAFAHTKGYVETLAGRWRRLKHQFGEKWNWRQMGYGDRQAVNAIIQGSAADIVRRTMINCRMQLPNLAQRAQVHDEIIFDRTTLQPSDLSHTVETIKRIGETQHGFTLNVPLLFEPAVVNNWAEKESGGIDLEALEE